MRHWTPRGKVLKLVVLTTIALIAMRLFYVQKLIILFLIFAAVLACVVALLVAGVLLSRSPLGARSPVPASKAQNICLYPFEWARIPAMTSLVKCGVFCLLFSRSGNALARLRY